MVEVICRMPFCTRHFVDMPPPVALGQFYALYSPKYIVRQLKLPCECFISWEWVGVGMVGMVEMVGMVLEMLEMPRRWGWWKGGLGQA
jgi:hypothetical protein